MMRRATGACSQCQVVALYGGLVASEMGYGPLPLWLWAMWVCLGVVGGENR